MRDAPADAQLLALDAAQPILRQLRSHLRWAPGTDVQTVPIPARRLALGAITLFGVYHGPSSDNCWLTCPLAAANSLATVWAPVAATLAASVAAGTVNRRAELTGLILAIAASISFAGPDLVYGTVMPEELLIGVPTLLLLVGSIGGFAGRLMVPPAPKLPRLGTVDSTRIANVKRKPARVIWWRVGMGVAIILLGTIYADPIREGLSKALAGRGGTYGASPMLSWQVSIIAAILGGVAAGMNTRSGARQGLTTGFVAAMLVARSWRGALLNPCC